MNVSLKDNAWNAILHAYRSIFLRKSLFRLNKLVFQLSLRGLGVLNYENDRLSGERFFLEKMAPFLNNSVTFDIGANVGRYSNKIRNLSETAKIFAFEPHPKNFEKLEHEASQRNYTAVNAACSDSPGKLKLFDYQGKSGSSHASLYQGVIDEVHNGVSEGWDVDVTTLDEFVKNAAVDRIRLLKIDTEGNELKVLMGSQEMLKKRLVDVIQFEFNEMNVVSKVFFKDIRNLLTGYWFYRLLPDGLVPLNEYSSMEWELFAYQNIVAISKEFIPQVKRSLNI